ncbi:MAG: DUF2309 domain-containing protein [Bdellovibrionales bacterium]|nr:DUF2309 domain-containing protein [Bdellovibrionales bacterium]
MTFGNGIVHDEPTSFGENDSDVFDDETVLLAAHDAVGRIAPCWDLHNYVAVNPFFPMRALPFLTAITRQQLATHSRLLPSREYFKEQYEKGVIQTADLIFAIEQIRLNQPIGTEIELSHDTIIETLEKEPNLGSTLRCFSDHYDQQNGTSISSLVTDEVSKWLSAYFDIGQAAARFPLRDEKFFVAWRRLATFDKSLDKYGIPFTEVIRELPFEPEHALQRMVQEVVNEVPFDKENLQNYFHRLLATVSGWASFGQHFEFEASRVKGKTSSRYQGIVLDILVLRMAYDLAVFRVLTDKSGVREHLSPSEDFQSESVIDYLWLLALERSFRKKLLEQIKPSSLLREQPSAAQNLAQLVFCIDVRSEPFRRHIERLHPSIQTIGFAGFFGIAMSLQSLGNELTEQNCPVLLEPRYRITESRIGKEDYLRRVQDKRERLFAMDHIRSSLSSCFSFVETIWPASFLKMIRAASSNSAWSPGRFGDRDASQGSSSESYDISVWSDEAKIEIAFSVLKGMSLLDNFAPLIVIFGHEGESENNPHASSLDCGACCGHSGKPNAVVLTQLLNDRAVRAGLYATHQIVLPDDTIFLSGVHNTTRGALTITVPSDFPRERIAQLQELENSIRQAQEAAQSELASSLPFMRGDLPLGPQLLERARDWSEVRPEWGLARNATFFVGRRGRTRSVDLWGRAFLHDYDPTLDHDGSVLELILTAPMVVTNWINLQYYASTVAPDTFGAGDKTLHNVVGGIGVIEGYSGDLQTGLSRQSVHYAGKYFHEPLRLQVVVEASCKALSAIIEKHEIVRDLVCNQWVNLISVDPITDEMSLFEAQGWLKL